MVTTPPGARGPVSPTGERGRDRQAPRSESLRWHGRPSKRRHGVAHALPAFFIAHSLAPWHPRTPSERPPSPSPPTLPPSARRPAAQLAAPGPSRQCPEPILAARTPITPNRAPASCARRPASPAPPPSLAARPLPPRRTARLAPTPTLVPPGTRAAVVTRPVRTAARSATCHSVIQATSWQEGGRVCEAPPGGSALASDSSCLLAGPGSQAPLMCDAHVLGGPIMIIRHCVGVDWLSRGAWQGRRRRAWLGTAGRPRPGTHSQIAMACQSAIHTIL